MGEENRAAPRILVSIHMACESADQGALHVQDLSSGGFLARGRIKAAVGSILCGSIHVLPSSGDRDVAIHGTVMRIVPDGEDLALGVRIDSFGSPDEEKSYLDFVRELYEDQ
jgi:hypothetical protein